MTKHPFESGLSIIETIESHGEQAYFVGGCVRDYLLKREIGDIDIATSATPQKIQKIFPSVIPVGIEHGTVIVRHRKQSFEVTTFRTEGKYTDQRHPDEVVFIDQINEDLKRRDFTMNALAMDKQGEIIDLFNGQKDLQNRLIRAVGDGHKRFHEDPLRMIRAIRFSSQLGFHIEQETLKQMIAVKKEIETVAVERILIECEKLFAGDHVNLGIDYLRKTKIYHHLPVMIKYPYIMERFPVLKTPLHSFGEVIACFHQIEKKIPISMWCNKWKCSNKIKREAMTLTKAIHTYQTNKGLNRWLVYQLPKNLVNGFVRLMHSLDDDAPQNLKAKIRDISKELPIHSSKELAITGHDIRSLFPDKQAGPWVGTLLRHIEKEVVFGRLPNQPLNIKEWILCNPPGAN